jgi:hypothetical protein
MRAKVEKMTKDEMRTKVERRAKVEMRVCPFVVVWTVLLFEAVDRLFRIVQLCRC